MFRIEHVCQIVRTDVSSVGLVPGLAQVWQDAIEPAKLTEHSPGSGRTREKLCSPVASHNSDCRKKYRYQAWSLICRSSRISSARGHSAGSSEPRSWPHYDSGVSQFVCAEIVCDIAGERTTRISVGYVGASRRRFARRLCCPLTNSRPENP
jgi:hypothetical protein